MDKADQWQQITSHIQNDAYARFLGASIEILKPGHCRVSLTITEDMTNFHGSTHGGIIFSISDMAFGAACNSHGKVAVALNVNICFVNPSFPGDRLTAEAKEVHSSRKISLYDITVFNEDTGKCIATTQNQAYRKEQWLTDGT